MVKEILLSLPQRDAFSLDVRAGGNGLLGYKEAFIL